MSREAVIQSRPGAIAVNFISFQIGWFLCVMAGVHDKPSWVIGATAVLLLAHFLLLRPYVQEVLLILSVGICGTMLDSCMIGLGVFAPLTPSKMPWLCPIWLSGMWMLFASTLTISLRWLWGSKVLPFLLGGVGGPMAYFAGYRLGAIEFARYGTILSLLYIGIVWAGVTYGLCCYSAWIERRYAARKEVAPVNPKAQHRATEDESENIEREAL